MEFIPSEYQEALRRSEARLSAIFSAAEIGLSEISQEGRFLFVNDKLCKILGRSHQEVLAIGIREVTYPEDLLQTLHAFQQLRETGKPVSLDKRYQRKDGKIIWASTTISLLPRENDSPTFLAVTEDLTERRQIEEKLRESEERFRLASEVVKIYSWEYHFNSETFKFSENFEKITGLKPVSTSREAIDYVFSEDRSKMKSILDKAKRMNGDFDFEIRLKAENGVNWYRISGTILRDEKGLPVRAAGISQKITQKKILEQQKDDFIGIASHELKTPVTSIKVYVEILREIAETEKDSQNALLLKKLDGQVDRLMKLIHDLLDATRTTEGQLPLKFEKFDLNNLIAYCIENFQAKPNNNLIFKRGDIPLVTADKERIGQVLTNLISNAIKYSPYGGEISVASSKVEGGVKVSVHDYGMGIPEEMQHKIFTRFFRVPSSEVQMLPGIGLGLYLSSMIIHRHGGALSVESKPGQGATFYFTLPFEHAANDITLL